MARQKKSEIDAILEQLKNSYFDDSRDIEEESTAKDPVSDEDAELAAVLERIFTEAEDESYKTNSTDATEAQEQKAETEEPDSDSLLLDAEPEPDEDVTIEAAVEIEPVIEAAVEADAEDKVTLSTTSKADETVSQDDAVKTEEARVDDVLKSMFHFASSNKSKSEAVNEEAESSINDEEPEILEAASTDETSYIEEAATKDISTPMVEAEEELPLNEEAEILVMDEPIDEPAYEAVDEPLEESDYFSIDEDYDDILIEDLEIEEPAIPEKKIVTDPAEYIEDIMQYSLSAIPFFKPQKDIDFSVFETPTVREVKGNDAETATASEAAEPKNEISDKEISLLMKLGYGGEINASGENKHAHRVIFDESKSYVPEKHKITHGFASREFSSREQIPAIKKKFKQDKLFILIQAIIVSLIALGTVVTDFIAAFSSIAPILLVSVSFWSTVAVMIILCKQIFAGVSAIFKFDTNQYSSPSIILIECFLYNLIVGLILTFGAGETVLSIVSVSGYAILYMAITVWGELMDCCKEFGVFNFIADNSRMYVAEKRTSADVSYNESKRRHASVSEESGNRYIVKQAKFVSGFHKKTANGKLRTSNVFFMIAIIPAIAIIVGMVVALFNESIIKGLSGMSFVLFLSAPLLNIISLSLIELLNYIKLKKNNSVFIGSKAAFAASNIQSVVFEDKDVIDIVDYTPINPNKKAENPQKWINIASRVFESLGGPLSKMDNANKPQFSNIDHDIAINSISDNGIDLYFDSSMNILIGDRTYMQSHGISVKTDVNLTGATRGADRSVIYMAFDKVPQIGFIVTSKIKRGFLKTIALLGSSKINIEVKSYEPEINEYFFEANIPDAHISTVKPMSYESTSASDVSDCELASSNPLDISRAIVYSKVIANDLAKTRSHTKIQSVIGFLSSLALCALICIPSNIKIIGILQEYSPILFYATALIMMIPNIIHTIKVLKRK